MAVDSISHCDFLVYISLMTNNVTHIFINILAAQYSLMGSASSNVLPILENGPLSFKVINL